MPSEIVILPEPSESTQPAAPSVVSVEELPLLVIESRPGWRALDWRELWRYRELLGFLTWRDVKIRYKQTVLGIAWAVLQPVMTMIVFTIFFGRFARFQDEIKPLPYQFFVYAGLLPWLFFTSSITNAGISLINSQNLLSKVYFPRLMIPLSSVGAACVDFAISFCLLPAMMVWYAMMGWYRVAPGYGLLLLPLALMLMALFTVGVAAIASGLTVVYRDFRYVIPFVIQLWMVVTPIMWPASIVPARWHWILSLNPMAGLVDTVRFSLLGWPADWTPTALLFPGLIAILTFLAGMFYFRRVERSFADIV
jgi:lipopolysaccharide transport system permease protein